MKRFTGAQQRHQLLTIYLSDHLAGATAGVELARRIAYARRHCSDGVQLRQLAGEIAADRAALIEIMHQIHVPVRRVKALGGWFGEKIGRLKPNGSLFSRSPLSTVIELETMRLGVEGKSAVWRSLREVAETDARLDRGRLDALIERAERQSRTLEQRRRSVARVVLAGRDDTAVQQTH